MDDMTFEEAMARLDEIARKMGEKQLPLQESLDLFKEASELIAYCNDALQKAELTVEEYKEQIFPEDAD